MDVTVKFRDKYTKNDQNRTVSTYFRLDGRKNGRDQDFRTFPENLKGVWKWKF